MPITAIDHVQLAMPAGGEDAARGFYRDLLGLPEVPKPAALAVRGGCWFENGSVKIHLGVEANFRPARKAHPALVVTDLRTLLDTCRARGIVVSDAEPLDGWRRAHVHDPFGNRIELMEQHSPAS
jgi:catechol 2,3-dioxygenase-like lactoylglutathione lyase family enzyme